MIQPIDYFRLKDLAKRFGVSVRTVRQALERDKVPIVILGQRTHVVRKDLVEAWIDSKTVSGEQIKSSVPVVRPPSERRRPA